LCRRTDIGIQLRERIPTIRHSDIVKFIVVLSPLCERTDYIIAQAAALLGSRNLQESQIRVYWRGIAQVLEFDGTAFSAIEDVLKSEVCISLHFLRRVVARKLRLYMLEYTLKKRWARALLHSGGALLLFEWIYR
jgi:hypothetical protein